MLLRTQRFAIHVLKQNQVRIKCRIQHIYSFIIEINLPRLTPFSLCVRKLDIVQLKSVFRWPLGHNIYLENQPIKIMILLDIWKLFVPRKPTFQTFQTDLWMAYVSCHRTLISNCYVRSSSRVVKMEGVKEVWFNLFLWIE